jgi:hypothetical protein
MRLPFRSRLSGLKVVSATLIMTVSVQGALPAAQFIAATFVEPSVFGAIRWVESVVALLLLVTAMGMPAVVIRQSAMAQGADDLLHLFVSASVLTTATAILVGAIGFVALRWWLPLPKENELAGAWLLLLLLIPANIARIGVAMVQGAERSRSQWRAYAVCAAAAVLAQCVLAYVFDFNGWVAGRFVVELALAALAIRFVRLHAHQAGALLQAARRRLLPLFHSGLRANFALLIRALADNAPTVLLGLVAQSRDELGFFGFMSLIMLIPMLALSVQIQVQIPSLVRAEGTSTFQAQIRAFRRRFVASSFVFGAGIAAMGWILQMGWVFAPYGNAAPGLYILALCLPLRAYNLAAGAALLARGMYAASYQIGAAEVAFVVLCVAAGYGSTSTQMALAVCASSFVALLPAWFLMRTALRPLPPVTP